MRLSISAISAGPHCDAIAAHFSCGICCWMERADWACVSSVGSLLIECCGPEEKEGSAILAVLTSWLGQLLLYTTGSNRPEGDRRMRPGNQGRFTIIQSQLFDIEVLPTLTGGYESDHFASLG